MSARPEHDLAGSFAKMKPADRPTVEAFLKVKRAQALNPASIANYALATARLSAALEDPIHQAPADAVVAYVADNVQNVWSPSSESTQKILIQVSFRVQQTTGWPCVTFRPRAQRSSLRPAGA